MLAMRLFAWRPLLIAIVAIGLPAPAGAKETLRGELGVLAENIIRNVKGQSLKLGQFTPVGLPDANGGPGLMETLRAELEHKQKGILQAVARFEVKGEYEPVPCERDPEQWDIKISVRIFDTERGEELKGLAANVKIHDTGVIGQIIGATVALPPIGTKRDRNLALQHSLKEPNYFIDRSIFKSRLKSSFAIEVLVNGAPRAAKSVRGLAFVEIERDEIFELRIHGRAEFEAEVAVTIDGIDAFTYSDDRDSSTGRPKYSHYSILAGNRIVIKGWHKTNDSDKRVNELPFSTTQYLNGATLSRATSKVGVITVTFARAWPSEVEESENEFEEREKQKKTRFRAHEHKRLVEATRESQSVREIVSVRFAR